MHAPLLDTHNTDEKRHHTRECVNMINEDIHTTFLSRIVALLSRAVPKFAFKPQTEVTSEPKREITSNLGN
jgi:hypothetical protein